MRKREMLIDGFEKVKTLMQYLYMSEDHYVEVENAIGVKLRISMRDDLNFYCLNMNFPDVHASRWSNEMTIPVMFDIISQLEDSPAEEFPKRFVSRWEEITEIVKTSLSLNI